MNQVRTSQQHTARIPGSEVRICYPFHPRAGQTVQIVACSVHAGVVHLTITQSDGTLAKIPAWMTEESAGTASINQTPVLPIAALLEVHAILGRSLHWENEESFPNGGGEHDDSTSPSTASVRCQSRSRGDPGRAPSEADWRASPGGRARRDTSRRGTRSDGEGQ